MIVLIRAMNTSRWKPPSKAAAKMKNFEEARKRRDACQREQG